MALPIFISHWAEHDNSLFEIGESKAFTSQTEAQNYIDLWRAYAAFQTNIISGFVVKQLLITDFNHNEAGQLSISSKFIDL
jgi:hypothetical protein